MKIPVLMCALMAFAVALGCAAGEPTRVPVLAIVCEPTLQREGDLITVALAKSPAVQLVERDQILALAEEKKALGLTEKGSTELGQLLSADGVLFLVETERDGRKMIETRLTAVHPGVVLEHLIMPSQGSIADETATQVSSRITPLLPKLAVSKNDAICVSFAGFFAPVDSPQLRSIERELSLLVLHRMTHEPMVFVLERKRMDQLLWEKDLNPTPAEPFRTGTWVVEGQLEQQGEELRLVMQLRQPGEKSREFALSGSRRDLSALTENIVEATRGAVKAGEKHIAWQPALEAAFFADQAAWALDHELIDQCIAAAESAWALGLHDASIIETRIKAYSLAAFPKWRDAPGEKLPRSGFNIGFYHYEHVDTRNSRALAAAIRALEICCECNSAKPETRPRFYEHYVKQAMLAGSAVLSSYFLKGDYQNRSSDLAYLRSLMRETSLWFNQLPVPKEPRYSIGALRAAHAPLWCETNDEVLKQYYRSLAPARIKDPPTHDSVELSIDYKLRWGRGYQGTEPELLAALSQRPLPWVFAWKPEENQPRQLDAMQKLKALISSARMEDQALGWCLLEIFKEDFARASSTSGTIWRREFARIFSPEKAIGFEEYIQQGIVEFLWQWRETIYREYRDGVALSVLANALRNGDREMRMRFVRSMVAEAGQNQMAMFGQFTNDLKLTEAEKNELSELDRGRKQSYPGPFSVGGYLETMEDSPVSKPPVKAVSTTLPPPPPIPAATPLPVTRFWNPMTHTDANDKNPGSRMSFRKAAYAEGKLWFFRKNGGNDDLIGQVSLNSFQTTYERIPLPGTMNESYGIEDARLQITPEAIYLPHAESLKKWDRKTGRWSAYDLPHYVYGAQLLGEAVYLLFDVGTPTLGTEIDAHSVRGSGILRVDRASDQVTLIAGSRRRPAQTVLDARPSYMPLGVFGGKKGALPGAVVESISTGDIQIYRQTAKQKDWELLYTIPQRRFIRTRFQPTGDGLLLHTNSPHTPAEFFDFSLLRGDGSSEVLLSIQNPQGPTMPGMPRWDVPPAMCGSNHKGWTWTADFYQERLHCIVRKSQQRHLLIFTPGKRDPVSIPLRMELSKPDETMLIDAHYKHTDTPTPSDRDRRDTINDIKAVNSLIVAPEGLILMAYTQPGFWFLPNTDIEKWISQNK